MARTKNKDYENLDLLHSVGIDIAKRLVYLMDDITDGVAAEVCKNLIYLDTLKEDEITLIICSSGGEVNAGMAIFDAIKLLRSSVKAVIMGHADSMASIIPQACATRLISRNSLMIIHEGSSGVGGHVRDVEAHGEWLRKDRERMYSIYLDAIARSGKKMERRELELLCRNDSYLTAEQAVNLGFVDGYVEDAPW